MGFVCPYYINLGISMGFDYNIVDHITPGSELNNNSEVINTPSLQDANESIDPLLQSELIPITTSIPNKVDEKITTPSSILNVSKNYKSDYKPDLSSVEEETEEALRAASIAMKSVKIESNDLSLTSINLPSSNSQLLSPGSTPLKKVKSVEVESPSFFTRFLPNHVTNLFFSPPKKEKRGEERKENKY